MCERETERDRETVGVMCVCVVVGYRGVVDLSERVEPVWRHWHSYSTLSVSSCCFWLTWFGFGFGLFCSMKVVTVFSWVLDFVFYWGIAFMFRCQV